jgi:hypothetical protein
LKNLSGAPLQGRLLTNSLRWQGLPGTNIVA